MLKLSTRLFAAGTLAALLISVTQDGFAHEKVSKASGKKVAAPCCVDKNGVMSCKDEAPSVKATAGKAKKPVAKMVSNAKVSPKSAVKAKAVKTAAKAAPQQYCPHTDPGAQPA